MPGDVHPGAVGGPVACCTLKLEDWPEGGYVAAEGHGEVHIGGPCVSIGYFIPDDGTKTAEEAKVAADLAAKNASDFYTDGNGEKIRPDHRHHI